MLGCFSFDIRSACKYAVSFQLRESIKGENPCITTRNGLGGMALNADPELDVPLNAKPAPENRTDSVFQFPSPV